MNKQETEFYAQCLTLPPDDRYAFLQKHGLTSEGLWQHKKQHHQPIRRRRKTRAMVLTAQGFHCALCGETPTNQTCMDRTGKVVCNRCNHYLAGWRHARSNGITEENTTAFNTSADDKTGDQDNENRHKGNESLSV